MIVCPVDILTSEEATTSPSQITEVISYLLGGSGLHF